MVSLAEVMVVVRTIGEIAEPDAHIVVDRTGDCDGDTDTEDGMGHGYGIDVSILKEEQAGGETPDQGHWCQEEAWQVRKSE